MAKAADIALPSAPAPLDSKLWLMLKTDTSANSLELMGRLAGIPGVREVHMTAGEWSFVLEVSGDGDSREIAHRLSRIPGVKGASGAVSMHRR
mgnify:CR=1 FL=1